jgi:hypothetical protein
MSEILAKLKRHGQPSYWLILSCGHWFKWSGPKPPAGDEFDCPTCKALPKIGGQP